jgi:hypothetical protein
MPEEIAKANIEHFKRLLETETEPKKCATIARLLAEEGSKLATLKKPRKGEKED